LALSRTASLASFTVSRTVSRIEPGVLEVPYVLDMEFLRYL
jgi:hypothetical protein